jgi:hypothetical protein
MIQFGSKKKDVDDFIVAEFSKINGGASQNDGGNFMDYGG